MDKHLLTVNDKWETPMYAIRDLLHWDGWQFATVLDIYEPFVGSGHSVNCFQKLGHLVHAPGGDFFKHNKPPPHWFLITNPPFTTKQAVLQRIVVEWNHPHFAILLPAPVLQTDYFRNMIEDVEGLDIMVPTARVKFLKNGVMAKKSSGFSVVWVCRGFPLKRGLRMHYLGHTGAKDA
tara:strand:+ start:6149 stop:6682 length:534 start_codon:yes stop_codon:yes gene_type:complete